MSKIRYLCGFGWGTLILFAALLAISVHFTGPISWISSVLLTFVTCYMLYQIWKYNGSPWRRIHFRAMLLYAHAAGIESYLAEREKRSFQTGNACQSLANYYIVDEVDAYSTISILDMFGGKHVADALINHKRELFPQINEELFKDMINHLYSLKLCPQIVIAKIIDQTYGEKETAKYAYALLTGDAK